MCLHLTNGDSSVLNPLKRLRGPCFLNFVENDHDRLQLYHRVVGTIGGWQHSKGSILGPSLYLEAEVINRQQHWEKVHLSYWVHGIHDSSEQKLLDMRISCWTSNTLVEAKLVQVEMFSCKSDSGEVFGGMYSITLLKNNNDGLCDDSCLQFSNYRILVLKNSIFSHHLKKEEDKRRYFIYVLASL